MTEMTKAVILARGLGTRMRKADDGAALSEEQARIAAIGVKALIPIDRPFLDYVLSILADTGYRRVCLVIGPEHGAIRDYYGGLKMRRIEIDYAIQEKPLGTADAVAAAEKFAASEPFLTINSDNYYPPESFAILRKLDGAGLAGFERAGMLAGSNIPAERLTKFAVIQTAADGRMVRIVEKPDQATLDSLPEPVCLSMNCWRFGPKIFQACRSISPSARGELELPDAVMYSMLALGETYRVCPIAAPVLDLSSRGDIEPVAAKLRGTEVRL